MKLKMSRRKKFLKPAITNPLTLHEPRHFVREWRKHREMTQEMLAEQTPFTNSAISQLETGRTSYTQEMLEYLAAALNCAPGDLISKRPEDLEQQDELFKIYNELPIERRKIALELLRSLLRT